MSSSISDRSCQACGVITKSVDFLCKDCIASLDNGLSICTKCGSTGVCKHSAPEPNRYAPKHCAAQCLTCKCRYLSYQYANAYYCPDCLSSKLPIKTVTCNQCGSVNSCAHSSPERVNGHLVRVYKDDEPLFVAPAAKKVSKERSPKPKFVAPPKKKHLTAMDRRAIKKTRTVTTIEVEQEDWKVVDPCADDCGCQKCQDQYLSNVKIIAEDLSDATLSVSSLMKSIMGTWTSREVRGYVAKMKTSSSSSSADPELWDPRGLKVTCAKCNRYVYEPLFNCYSCYTYVTGKDGLTTAIAN